MTDKILRDKDGQPLYYQDQMRRCMNVVRACHTALEKLPARNRTMEQKYAIEQAEKLQAGYDKFLERARAENVTKG